MQVACATTVTPSSAPVTITGWTYALQGGVYTASRVLRATLRSGSQADRRGLERATGDQAQHIGVEAYRHVAQQRAGRYGGILTLGGGMFFFFQAEDGIRDGRVTGVQTCALPI